MARAFRRRRRRRSGPSRRRDKSAAQAVEMQSSVFSGSDFILMLVAKHANVKLLKAEFHMYTDQFRRKYYELPEELEAVIPESAAPGCEVFVMKRKMPSANFPANGDDVHMVGGRSGKISRIFTDYTAGSAWVEVRFQ